MSFCGCTHKYHDAELTYVHGAELLYVYCFCERQTAAVAKHKQNHHISGMEPNSTSNDEEKVLESV